MFTPWSRWLFRFGGLRVAGLVDASCVIGSACHCKRFGARCRDKISGRVDLGCSWLCGSLLSSTVAQTVAAFGSQIDVIRRICEYATEQGAEEQQSDAGAEEEEESCEAAKRE